MVNPLIPAPVINAIQHYKVEFNSAGTGHRRIQLFLGTSPLFTGENIDIHSVRYFRCQPPGDKRAIKENKWYRK